MIHGAVSSSYSAAIDVCDFIREHTTVVDESSGVTTPLPSVSPHHLHRLQGLLFTSGNLRLHLAGAPSANSAQNATRDYIATIEVTLSPIAASGSSSAPPSTLHECYSCENVVIAAVMVGIMAAHPKPPVLRDLAMAMGVLHWPGLDVRLLEGDVDIVGLVKRSGDKLVQVLTRLGSGVLPTVLMTPELAAKLPRLLFPSAHDTLPGVCTIAAPSSRPGSKTTAVFLTPPSRDVAEHANRLAATVMLTLGKVLQADAPEGFRPFNDSVRTSSSLYLLLHYLAYGLSPSASTCNNIGILLATTSYSVQDIICADEPRCPLTGSLLAEVYYKRGLALDPDHPHLLVNMGSLAKDRGDLPKAMQYVSFGIIPCRIC